MFVLAARSVTPLSSYFVLTLVIGFAGSFSLLYLLPVSDFYSESPVLLLPCFIPTLAAKSATLLSSCSMLALVTSHSIPVSIISYLRFSALLLLSLMLGSVSSHLESSVFRIFQQFSFDGLKLSISTSPA